MSACNFIKKETLAQVFSCEFCEISKNTFLHISVLVAASDANNITLNQVLIKQVNGKEVTYFCIVFLNPV